MDNIIKLFDTHYVELFKWALPATFSHFDSRLPMTGFKLLTLASEATALPTEPQPLPQYDEISSNSVFWLVQGCSSNVASSGTNFCRTSNWNSSACTYNSGATCSAGSVDSSAPSRQAPSLLFRNLIDLFIWQCYCLTLILSSKLYIEMKVENNQNWARFGQKNSKVASTNSLYRTASYGKLFYGIDLGGRRRLNNRIAVILLNLQWGRGRLDELNR